MLQTSSIVFGINETIKNHSLNNYPNPFHDYTFLNLPDDNQSEQVSFTVYNVYGVTVFSRQIKHQKELKFYKNELPAGIYIYEVKGLKGTIAYGKMIIE